jgi:hypothetical protein
MVTCIQEPLEIGRRGRVGKCLNGNTLAAVNGHLRPLRESVAYGRDVGVGGPATVMGERNRIEFNLIGKPVFIIKNKLN